jgi:hypothetical protein
MFYPPPSLRDTPASGGQEVCQSLAYPLPPGIRRTRRASGGQEKVHFALSQRGTGSLSVICLPTSGVSRHPRQRGTIRGAFFIKILLLDNQPPLKLFTLLCFRIFYRYCPPLAGGGGGGFYLFNQHLQFIYYTS